MSIALNLEALRKSYKNGFEALKGINLSVATGDFFALLGPNGAGKSTTIGIVSSIVVKTAGRITIGGYDLEQDADKAKALIGVMPQEVNLNIFENCMQILLNQASYYGVKRRQALKDAERLLHRLDLFEKRNTPIKMLSGGMKRRFMVARALIHKPEILILDEPTAGVDVELRQTMWQFFRELNQEGVTIILTTHYLEEAEMLCRNAAIINKGEIIRNGTMTALLSELESETLIFDLAEPLHDLPFLEYPAELRSPMSIAVQVARGQCLNEIFAALIKADVQVKSMRNEQNRLERIFLKLTRIQGENQ